MLAKLVAHGGHPVLRWMAGNTTIETDAAENIKPSKKKSTERIDGIVSTVMALGRAITIPEKKQSVYESRGVITIGSGADRTESGSKVLETSNEKRSYRNIMSNCYRRMLRIFIN